MNKSGYPANSAECQRMAAVDRSRAEKTTWLEIAESWLRLMPYAKRSGADAHKHSTGQANIHGSY